MKLEMTGWQWHQLDHTQIICTSLNTDNHTSTLSLYFYRPDALLDFQPTTSRTEGIICYLQCDVWRGGATGKAFGLAMSRSRVQILLEAMLRNNLRQVVYTYVPLSPNSISWYRPKGGDALRYWGGNCRPGGK